MNRTIYMALLLVVSFTANAATFNVISGTFDAIDPSSGSLGLIQLTGNSVMVEGVYNGDAAGLATDPNATYAGFETASFLGTPLYFYFAPSGVYDDPFAPQHSAPTIDFGAMTADMTSMFANWNSTPPTYIGEFNVGGVANVVPLGANTWELSWSHIQTSGPFEGVTTEITMVVEQVPIPAAVWLFGSGLLGIIGLARRKLA